MATNNAIWKEIQKLKANWGVRDDSTLYNMLSNEQKRVFLKKSPGVKRVVSNTAPVVSVAAAPLSLADKEKLRVALITRVFRERITPVEFIATLDTDVKKNYVRELLTEKTQVPNTTPLRNCGNSCYMNAEMQLLFSIPELRELFSRGIADWKEKKVSGITANAEKSQMLLRDFNQLFAAMNTYAALGIPLNPATLVGSQGQGKAKEKMRLYNEILSLIESVQFRQEDAGEFLNKVFSTLFSLCFLLPLKNKFRFYLKDQKFCANRAIVSPPRFDYAGTLDLQIEDPRIVDIQTALDVYQSETPLVPPYDNLVSCAEGRAGIGKGQSEKITIIVPDETKYALINLKRNTFEGMALGKNSKPVRLNPEIRIGESRFKLRSCVAHLGRSPTSGHYVMYKFDDSGNPVVRFDDSHIYTVKASDVQDDFAIKRTHGDKILVGALTVLYERIGPVADFEGFKPFDRASAVLRLAQGDTTENIACLFSMTERDLRNILEREQARNNAIARLQTSPEALRTTYGTIATAAAARAPRGGRQTRKQKKRSRKTRRN